MTPATLPLNPGREHVAIEPRHVMAFHPAWLPNPESPEDAESGRMVTRIFFATGMQLDVAEEFDVVAGRLMASGWA